MNALIIAAAVIGGPAAGVGLLRLSARLSVVQWDGPADHPRHAPKYSDGTR